MNLNNYTIKSQELIQAAQQLAFNSNNPNIESNHLLKALLNDKESTIEYFLKKNNVNIQLVSTKNEEALNILPNTAAEPAQSISRDLNNVLLQANASLKEFKDEFVNPEHFLIGLLKGKDDVSKILKDAGLTEKGLIASIKELRKGSTINSQTSTQQHNSLQKYAKNLNELAQQW
jgi:ATP-dependent Clp protease ATP-binding subunit ClpB